MLIMKGVRMKRVPVSYIKAILRATGIKANVFLSDKKTILEEPVKDSTRLWFILHEQGFWMLPEGNGYYRVIYKERN